MQHCWGRAENWHANKAALNVLIAAAAVAIGLGFLITGGVYRIGFFIGLSSSMRYVSLAVAVLGGIGLVAAFVFPRLLRRL